MSRGVPFIAVVNPDNVKVSVRLYTCGSDGRIIIQLSMKLSDVAILAFIFCSRVLFVLNMAEKTVLSRDNCRLT